MSNRSGGGGRRGGGGGRGDFQRQAPPGGAPAYAPSQQRGRGRGGAGRGGGGGGDGEAFPPFPTRREQPAPPPHHPAPKPADLPSSSSSAASASAPSQDFERLTIREAEPSGSAMAPAAPPAAADPATAPPPASSKSVRHPKRPGYGTIGKKCIVRANHFLVNVADADLCHYDVAITPEVTSRAINRALIKELINLYGVSHLGKKKPAYDGRKSLYTAGALPFESKDFVIKLPPKDKTSSKVDKEYRIAIRSAGRADLHHLQQFLRGQQMDAPYETIQCLDVVLREYPSANYTPVSRSFFSPKFGHRDDIGDGLECWRGYYQSLRPTQMGLSLNIDISATSFYKAVPVIDFVAEYLNLRDVSRPLNDRDRVKVKKALRGLRVEGTHQKDTIRRYKITGITALPLNQLTFELAEDGKKTSVVQYFKERYNYSVRHVSWPAIQSGSDNKPIYLPMEVCKIVEGQRYSKKLNDRQVTAILRLTCKRPQEREKSIQTMVDSNNYSKDEFAVEFGIQVMNKLASVDARVLPPPRLKYHESGREKTCNPSVGQWNMINKKMVNGGTVENWTCLNFSRIQHEAVEQFCMDLEHMCNTIGMRFKPAPLIRPQSVHPGNIEAALRDVHRQSAEVLTGKGIQGKNLQLLIIVLPDMTGSYGTIKRVCETELGIVTQCCLPKNVAKSNKQYLENVSLKINVKVGGRNTVLEDALRPNAIPFVNDKPTIIFGADVTHPPPGEDSSSSIAAVVASMDWPEVTKYRGLVSAQTHRQEMINDLYTKTQYPKKGSVHGGMIRELLVAFYRSMRQKPHRIIFYRDGVSEGQFNHVLLYEMDAIRKACASLEEGYLPPVTFVVVQKRHHTRLFPAVHGNRDSTDRSGNILPGTVVDTTICHPTEFDFYLCSHAGIQGTSRPTHYHVLFDENHFTADALQTLTNNLCYTYARCTRSVSVVPPAYYAHLAAFRARYYTEGDSEGGSMTSAGAGARGTRERTAVVRPLPLIMDNVKDVMFFC